MPTRRVSFPARAAGRFVFALAAAASLAAATAWVRAAPQDPAPAAGQKPAPEPQQPPTFRTEANFVRVDVYPTADGRAVQDLAQPDFEVFEDGVQQDIRTFEHVVIETGGPQETRSDPKSVREAQDMIADPRARLFILFLDTYHVSREGAYNVRRSISRLLERSIAPADFVAVMTPDMSARSVTFTRRTGSIDEALDQWITWGKRHEEVVSPDPVEARYQDCYPPDPSLGESRISAIASEMTARRREKLTLDAMRDLVSYLRGLREERKAILMVSEGWALYQPNSNLARPTGAGQVPGPPQVGVGPTGGLRVGDLGRNVGGSRYECDQDRLRLAQEDHEREFRELLDEANRANASFYSIDPRGLPVFDTPISAGPLTSPAADQAMLRSRQETLRTLASATDGMAVMNSNDIDKGLKRVVDDLTSYYLLGYYSTHIKPDGRFHSISVKVKRPGVSVRARRGYRAPTSEEAAEASRAAVRAPRSEASVAARAVNALSRIREDAFVHATAGYEWRASAAGPLEAGLWIVLELDATAVTRDELWKAGADVAITVTAADRSRVGEARQELKRDARAAMVRIPIPQTWPGDYAIKVTSRPAGATLGSTDSLRVVVPRPGADGLPAGQPLLFRRGPFSGVGWQLAGDPRYRRQERVKVELAVYGQVTAASVQLQDRNGKPLAVPVVSATREEEGRTVVSGEATLAPLTTGDYVLEASFEQGGATKKVAAAFRIIS